MVALLYAYAAHAAGGAAHLTHVLGFKSDALPLGRYDRYRVALGREIRRDEFVPFLQINRDDAGAPHVGEGARRDPLRRALLGDKGDRRGVERRAFGHREHARDRLIACELEEVHDALALGRALPLRYLIHLELVRLAEVGEEEEVAVRRSDEEVRHHVFFLRRDIHHADAAALLYFVFVRVRPLHVAALGEHKHRLLVRHEIFFRNVLHAAPDDSRAAIVAVHLREPLELALHYRQNLFRRRKDVLELCDELLHLGKLVFYLLTFEAGELRQPHFEDRRGLQLREAELLLKRRARGRDIRRLLDDRDDLVDMVERFREPEEDVLPCGGLPQIEFGAALHDFLPVRDEMLEHSGERKHFRHAMHEREHIVMEGALELSVLIQGVQDRLRMRGALELHDDADVRGGLVAQVADALELLLLHQVGNAADKLALVHAIRNGGDDDARFAPSRLPAGRQVVHDLRLAAHDHRPFAAAVCMLDIRLIESDATQREIGAFDELEQIVGRRVRIVDEIDGGVDDLAEIVRRDIGRHPDRDAERAVEE